MTKQLTAPVAAPSELYLFPNGHLYYWACGICGATSPAMPTPETSAVIGTAHVQQHERAQR